MDIWARTWYVSVFPGCVSYAPYLIRDLIAFCWKFIWRNKQQRCPCWPCGNREWKRERERERRRVGKGVGENDTHNCSIISHKVKNCCSILGVIQSRLSSSSGRAGQTWLLYENVLWYFPESTYHAGTYVDIPSPHRHAATFWADNCIYGCSFNVITGLVKMGIKRLPYCTCLPWLLLFFFYRALFWSPAKSNFKVEEYHTNERDYYGR